jgi:FtsH-binding integral membrane protein
MSDGYLLEGYYGETAANARTSARIAFIRRTYAHLAGAIIAFALLCTILMKAGVGHQFLQSLRVQQVSWLLVLVAFIGVSYLAQWMARSQAPPATQYLGLALYVVAEAIIFLPMLALAEDRFPGKHIALQAGLMTAIVFGGLTAAVFLTRKDFSFLGHGLMVLAWMALGLIVCALLFGFGLGMWFSLAMIALASGFILYNTSNVLHHYRTDEHVAAALELFASVALLFWYILRLIMETAGNND